MSVSLMRLMQLTSPSLPVGAFAYSQGLESAVEIGLLTDLASSRLWIKNIMSQGLARLDVPIFYRLYRAWQALDEAELRSLNAQIFAQRETSELQAEDAHMGGALSRLLIDLGMTEAALWQRSEQLSFTTMFALAAVKWDIEINQAATGLLWSWLENQVAAAIKLVPLGQTDGQRLIGQLLEDIPALLVMAQQLPDDEIGSCLPMLAILSAQHETQYSRLFRS
ncbi:urease accessory protein UreF [Leucothrix arctica]|uniref:Urease accessory protein UreF n=1 Tax=Leucothrix arctica TaxID=1481894 RepID=A0A317C9E2_9GAMM|nr:urease accessory protein UreF [Leucothrix arctica]